MMLGRNLVFRVSIVINIAWLLYAAMNLNLNSTRVEWVPITADGSDRTVEFRYLNQEEIRNETETRPAESSARIFEESTSQKVPTTRTTVSTANKTVSSTASIAEYDKIKEKFSVVPSEIDLSNETLEITDENGLTDATLARLRSLLACTEKDFSSQTLQRGEFWVLKNYIRADHGTILCHETVTYSTHTGIEFLNNVEPLLLRWMSPISIAIHAPGTDYFLAVNSIRYLRDCTGHELIKQYVTFHLFFSNKHIPSRIIDPETFLNTPFNCTQIPPYHVNTSATYMKKNNLLYPINVGRNIARDSALTHFILPSDIELYPSPNLPPRFLNMIARNAKPLNTSRKPKIFPIPIFEVASKAKVPSSKTELQRMLADKTAVPFHKFVCPNCHNIPQGQQWMTAKETSQMEVFSVSKRHGKFKEWEPIYIGTHADPHYDERLSWEGKRDKMPQGYILCLKDYDFMILNNAFLTHRPGIKHYVKDTKRDSIAKRQSSFIKNTILPELKKLYGARSNCHL